MKTAIFDLDDTLWGHDYEKESIFLSSRLGILEVEHFKLEFYTALKKLNAYLRGREITESQVIHFFEKNIQTLSSITGNELLNAFNLNEDAILDEYVPSLLSTLHKNDFNTIILTDWFDNCQLNALKRFDLLKFFKSMYSWSNLGHLKSDLRTVNKVIKGNTDDYIMIGDGLESDIAFANNASIKSIWLNPQGKENHTIFVPTFEVKSLKEAEEILLNI